MCIWMGMDNLHLILRLPLLQLLLFVLLANKQKTLDTDDDTGREYSKLGSIAQRSRITLNWPFYVTHFQRAVVYRLAEQKKSDQEQADVGNEHSTVILCIGHGAIGNAHADC